MFINKNLKFQSSYFVFRKKLSKCVAPSICIFNICLYDLFLKNLQLYSYTIVTVKKQMVNQEAKYPSSNSSFIWRYYLMSPVCDPRYLCLVPIWTIKDVFVSAICDLTAYMCVVRYLCLMYVYSWSV